MGRAGSAPCRRQGRPLHDGADHLPRRPPPRACARTIAERRRSTTSCKAVAGRGPQGVQRDLPGRGEGASAPPRTRTHVPSLRDIRTRITSVKSTQADHQGHEDGGRGQAAPRAGRVLEARPYASLLDQALGRVAARAAAEESATSTRCWRARRGARRRGGGHHLRPRPVPAASTPTSSAAPQRFITENGDSLGAGSSSAPSAARAKRLPAGAASWPIRKDCAGVHQGLDLREGRGASPQELVEALPGRRGRRGLPRATTSSRAPSPSTPVVVQLLPARAAGAGAGGGRPAIDFNYEPSREAAARRSSCPRHVAMQVWRALLESAASEHGARMTRHGVGHQERRGDDRGAHPPVQPRAPGLRHQGAHGDRGRRRGAQVATGKAAHGHRDELFRTARSPRSSAPSSTWSSRRAACRRSTPRCTVTNPAIDDRARQPHPRGRPAPRREHRALHRHGHHRRPGARHGGEEHRRPHPHAGRQGGARPHPQRRRRAGRRARPGQGHQEVCPSTARRRRFVDQNAKIEIFETGIKVIDLLAPYRAAARSASSAAPASARPCSSWSSSTTSPRSTAASRCSPASASAPARATTSATR